MNIKFHFAESFYAVFKPVFPKPLTLGWVEESLNFFGTPHEARFFFGTVKLILFAEHLGTSDGTVCAALF